MTEPMNKAERLAVAAQIAPTLREHATKAKSRRVKTVDADGNVVRVVSLAEVQEGLLAAKKIEIAVVAGVKAKEICCATCGKIERVKPGPGHARKYCVACGTIKRQEHRRKSKAQYEARKKALRASPEHKIRVAANLAKSHAELSDRNRARAAEMRALREENERLREENERLKAQK